MDLVELCNSIAPELSLREGYQDCPFCHRSKKFRVSTSHYRCFHPDCGKQGGLISFVQDIKGCDYKTAVQVVNQARGSDSKAWVARTQFLELVFSVYQNGVDDRTLEFLNDRGYAKALEAPGILFGHAVGDNFLQTQGLALSELVKYGLAYSNGKEFFRDRVIFPIRDLKGRLVHFQGRSVNPDVELRWLSTSSKSEVINVAPVSSYLYESHYYFKKDSIDWLFLSEGISDGLSLVELEASVVSCFGVEVDLLKFLPLWEKVKNLVVLLDNDRYPLLTSKAGLYKSWTAMLPRLVELQVIRPELQIWCCPPPEKPGIKDVNNWLSSGLTQGELAVYVMSKKQSLFDFALDNFFSLEFHPLLIKLFGVSTEEESKRFGFKIASEYKDTIDYLKAVHGYF